MRSVRCSVTCEAQPGTPPDAFVTGAELPTGDALKGRWIALTFDTYKVVASGTPPMGLREQKGIRHLYEIAAVQRDGDRTLVPLAEDPELGLKDGKAIESARPHRTFEGPVAFEITLCARD